MSTRQEPSSDWRSGRAVLVGGAETVAGIAVIRSLGRAGYRVHACSDDPHALGFASRWAGTCAVCPAPGGPDFDEWLRGYVEVNAIQLIVPTEAMLIGLRPSFERFAPLLPLSSDESVVYTGFSKFDVLKVLGEADQTEHVPATLFIEDTAQPPLESALVDLGAPLFVKGDGIHSDCDHASATEGAGTSFKASVVISAWAQRYRRAIVQGHVPGQGVGAFFLLHQGEVRAEFMHRRLHEVPHTGGVSSLRESWRHDAIRDDALAKLRALRWEGVAMMEYRWDAATNRFWFIEMNGRFWGSLHLALHAGIDFPRLMADAFFGRAEPAATAYPLGLRCRHTCPKEVQYVWSRWKDKRLSLAARLVSVIEFGVLSLDPRVFSDMDFRGDRRLVWESWKRFVRSLGQGRWSQSAAVDVHAAATPTRSHQPC